MSNLNLFEAGEQRMSSREIAKLTGKQHGHVIRDCNNLNANYLKINELPIMDSYEMIQMPNGGEKTIKVLYLTKMQTFDLITGYNTELRIKVNRRWAELEAKEQSKLPQSFSEALQLAADQAKALELQQPKVNYYDNVLQSESLISTNEIAKELGLSAITLNKKIERSENTV